MTLPAFSSARSLFPKWPASAGRATNRSFYSTIFRLLYLTGERLKSLLARDMPPGLTSRTSLLLFRAPLDD